MSPTLSKRGHDCVSVMLIPGVEIAFGYLNWVLSHGRILAEQQSPAAAVAPIFTEVVSGWPNDATFGRGDCAWMGHPYFHY